MTPDRAKEATGLSRRTWRGWSRSSQPAAALSIGHGKLNEAVVSPCRSRDELGEGEKKTIIFHLLVAFAGNYHRTSRLGLFRRVLKL
jgi:hypothetical protein